jgi:hypothetical protein
MVSPLLNKQKQLQSLAFLEVVLYIHPLRSTSSGYPEGNFGGNQLLGGSMSLSPLCPGQTTRFARQDGGQPPPRFPKALLCPGIAHHLSGPTAHVGTQNPVR